MTTSSNTFTIPALASAGSKELHKIIQNGEIPEDVKNAIHHRIPASVNSEVSLSIQATIFPKFVTLKDGVLEKHVSISDFVEMLNKGLDITSSFENFALPVGCYLFKFSSGKIQLGVYHAERDAIIEHGSKSYKVRMPNVIISFSLRKEAAYWQIINVNYYATDREVPQLPEDALVLGTSKSQGIYRMPFTNFYPEGRMCYGSNILPTRFTHNLRGLDYYYQVLTLAPFNNDLWPESVSRNKYPSITRWFEFIKAGYPFPYSELQ